MTTLRDLVLRVEAADVTEAIARLYDRGEKTKVMFEYILIAGVNDTDEQARELAKIARRLGQDQSHSIQHRRRPGMVTPLARAAGEISIDPAEARCDRNLAPQERPRYCRRLRSITTTDEAFSPNVNGATG